MKNSRRQILLSSLVVSAGATFPFDLAFGTSPVAECSLQNIGLLVESNDTPFFEHHHQLEIPIASLINIPADGIIVKSTTVDQGSYDVEGFKKFIASSGLNADMLREHSHSVQISSNHLSRIAAGEKDVEIRVISKAGNYVHNFLVTASPMILARIRRGHK